MFAASRDTDIPFIFSEPQFTISFEGNALSGNGEKCIECRKESQCDCRDCGAYNHTNACHLLATSFHGTPHYYMSASLGEALFSAPNPRSRSRGSAYGSAREGTRTPTDFSTRS